MAELLTLIAQLDDVDTSDEAGPAGGFEVRPCDRSDFHPLGRLYFEAYDPGVACDSLEDAIADIEAAFNGEYGDFWFQASPVVEAEGRIVSLVMAVHRAPWDDTPDCPFIIELLTARNYRRNGLARLVVEGCLATVKAAGESAVALRVDEDNTPARALYESIGFGPLVLIGRTDEMIGADAVERRSSRRRAVQNCRLADLERAWRAVAEVCRALPRSAGLL